MHHARIAVEFGGNIDQVGRAVAVFAFAEFGEPLQEIA